MPTISIIMNVRNGAITLREALESVFAQTYRDWELIVWDDCSCDDSAKIVAEFADPRLRYLLAPAETSLGQARELAIREARGDWLAFLDQDDIWAPRKLELQAALTNSPEVGLVYGRAVCFYPGGRERDYDQFHEFSALPEGDVFGELLGKGCFIAMSSVLLRRSAVTETGGIPDHIKIVPDYFLYLALSQRYSARAVQQVVCRYRVHSESMTKRYRRESLAETLSLVEELRSHGSPGAFGRRHAGISTALALEEMRHWGTITQGVKRMLDTGSFRSMARASVVRIQRMVNRYRWQPEWKRSDSSR